MLLHKPDTDHQKLYSGSNKSKVQRKGICLPVLCLATVDGGKTGNKMMTLFIFDTHGDTHVWEGEAPRLLDTTLHGSEKPQPQGRACVKTTHPAEGNTGKGAGQPLGYWLLGQTSTGKAPREGTALGRHGDPPGGTGAGPQTPPVPPGGHPPLRQTQKRSSSC